MAIYLNGQLVAGSKDGLKDGPFIIVDQFNKDTANINKIYVVKDVEGKRLFFYHCINNTWYSSYSNMGGEVSE